MGSRALMERIQGGDAAAFDEVLRRFWLPLVSYATHLLTDRDGAEDAVQEALLRFWEGRSDWMPSDRLGGFLYQSTRNLCLNELDKRRVRAEVGETGTSVGTGGIRYARGARGASSASSALDQGHRRVASEAPGGFVLARFHARTYRDIAEIMDISPRTVANQLSAAVRDLRRRLRPEMSEFLGDSPSE